MGKIFLISFVISLVLGLVFNILFHRAVRKEAERILMKWVNDGIITKVVKNKKGEK